MFYPQDSSVDESIVLRSNNRPSRRVTKSVTYNDSMEDSDGDEAPPVKKPRSEAEKTGKVFM